MKNLVYLFATICAAQTCAAQMVYFNQIYPTASWDNGQCSNILINEQEECYEIFIVDGDAGEHSLIRKRIDFAGNELNETSIFFGDTIVSSGIPDAFNTIGQDYLFGYYCNHFAMVEMYNSNFLRVWRYNSENTDTSGSAISKCLTRSDGTHLCVGVTLIENNGEIGDDLMEVDLIELDENGIQTNHFIVNTEKSFGQMRSIHELSNGDIILTGTQAFDYDAVVLRLDSLGNVLWQKTFQSPTEDERDDLWCQSVLVNDSTLVLNYGYGFGDEYPPQPWIMSSVRKLHLVKLNLNGQEIIWEKNYPSIYGVYHYNNDMLQSPDNGFVMVGGIENSSFWPIAEPMVGFHFSYIAKADADGNLLWRRNYTFSPDTSMFVGDWNELYDIELAPDGGYVACGYLNDFDLSPQYQAWVIKVDEYGCLEPGCQNIDVTEIVLGFENSMSVFPNPVKDICTIEWNVDKVSTIEKNFSQSELIITDTQGREIQRLPISNFGNQHQMQIDMSGYASGMYQVHWVSGSAWLDTVQVVKEKP